MTWLKKGYEFLPSISIEELKTLYKKEKNAKAKLRLLAAIQRKQGKTLDDIALSIEKPKMTISDWLRRLVERGIGGVYDVKQPGKPPRLSKNQLKRLEKILSESPEKQKLPFVIWTSKLAQYIILELFNIKYELWNIRKIIHKLDFTLQTPRQKSRYANEKAQEEFKKNLKQKYSITLNLDLRSSVVMKHTLS